MPKYAAIALALSLSVPALAAEEPQFLKDARAREGKPIAATAIASKDGWFKARIPAKLVNSIEKVEGSYSVELDADSGGAPVYCEVYPDGIDLVHALRNTLENTLKDAEAKHGKVETRVLEAVDAGAYGDVPFISNTWLYRAKTDAGAMLGGVKQFVMDKNGVGVYCAHVDLGYTKTFAAVTKAFAESLETKAAFTTPYYLEIATASMPNWKVGVAVTTLERDSEGDIKARQMTAFMVPLKSGAVMTQDATHIAWLSPDASLINASSTDFSNGEVESILALKFEDGSWVVSGEVDGKKVAAKLPEGSEPGNWVAQALELRTLLAAPNPVGQAHVMPMWTSEDPYKLVAAKTTILSMEGAGRFKARGDYGAINANLVIEKSSGMVSAAELEMGPIRIKLERVFVRGSF